MQTKYGVYAVMVKGVIKYVGGGDIKDCISRHRTNLKNDAYMGTNKEIIQKAYNENPKDITYDTLEYVSNNKKDPRIKEREDYYIKLHKNTICNVNPATRPLRSNNPEKRKAEYQKRSKINSADKNPNYSGKLKVPEDIIRIKILLESSDMSQKEIAELFEISPNMVSRIKNKDRYASIKIEDYNKMIDLRNLDECN